MTASWLLGLHHRAPPENQDSLKAWEDEGLVTCALAARLPEPMGDPSHGAAGCGCACAASPVLFTWATLNCREHNCPERNLLAYHKAAASHSAQLLGPNSHHRRESYWFHQSSWCGVEIQQNFQQMQCCGAVLQRRITQSSHSAQD